MKQVLKNNGKKCMYMFKRKIKYSKNIFKSRRYGKRTTAFMQVRTNFRINNRYILSIYKPNTNELRYCALIKKRTLSENKNSKA